jgi:hypothetical protein
VRDSVAKYFHREHAELQGIADRLRDQGIETAALLVQGATAETILQEANKLQVNMIVVGSHGHGAVHQLLVGSVSENVLREATTPVLVVPTREGARQAELGRKRSRVVCLCGQSNSRACGGARSSHAPGSAADNQH